MNLWENRKSAGVTSQVFASSRYEVRAKRSCQTEKKGDVITELTARGLVHQQTSPKLAEIFAEGKKGVYAGFDPTADSLHVGNLVTLMALLHFQRAGHRPIALVGGATGLIGDPSGRSTERPLLDAQEIEKNVAGIKACIDQLSRVQHPEGVEITPIEVVNNAEFYKDYKDSVKNRLSTEGDGSGTGLSFTEFSYQTLQAYDFLHLFKQHNCILQVGGSDQWGNIVAGTDLIRKLEGGEAYGLTLPLITTKDGKKIGKSAGNAPVWLSPERTSDYHFYQHFRNIPDSEVATHLACFTLLPHEKIQEIMASHQQNPDEALPQKTLAEEVTKIVRGQEAMEKVKKVAQMVFGGEPFTGLSSQELLTIFNDVPTTTLEQREVIGQGIMDIMKKCRGTSKAETKRLVKAGGLYLNNKRLRYDTHVVTWDETYDNSFCILRVGKKDYHVVKISNGPLWQQPETKPAETPAPAAAEQKK